MRNNKLLTSGLRVARNKADGIADSLDLLGGVIGNLDAELFFECHDQLDRVEAVRTQVVDELGALVYLGSLDSKMLDNNLFHTLGNVAHLKILPVIFDLFRFRG